MEKMNETHNMELKFALDNKVRITKGLYKGKIGIVKDATVTKLTPDVKIIIYTIHVKEKDDERKLMINEENLTRYKTLF